MSVIALNLTVLVLLATTVFLLGGLVVTSRRLRRTSRRVKAAELARQQLTAGRQAQDMALAVAERARVTLQDRADRVPELERSIASLQEALERAEDELGALRGESRPREATTVQVHDAADIAELRELIMTLASDQRQLHAEMANLVRATAVQAHDTAENAELRELITTVVSDQRQLHAEMANFVRVFSAHFTAMGRALAEKDIAETGIGEPK